VIEHACAYTVVAQPPLDEEKDKEMEKKDSQ